MKPETVRAISRVGSVVMATILSFTVYPPSITNGADQGINWKNIFVFFAGVVSIYLFNNKTVAKKTHALYFLVALILLLGCYELLFQNYSMNCDEQLRVVVPHTDVMQSVLPNLEYWKNHSRFPIQNLIEAYGCSSNKVWHMEDLAPVYYSFIILYFLIIITTSNLIVIIADLVNDNRNDSFKPE